MHLVVLGFQMMNHEWPGLGYVFHHIYIHPIFLLVFGLFNKFGNCNYYPMTLNLMLT